LIQVIDKTNAYAHAETLRLFAALRHRVFVERLGWRLPCREPGFEQDQFDNSNAVYLIAIDHDGQVTGGTRLLDTSRGSLLAEVFPYLLDGSPPADPKIFEVTRFIAASSDGGYDLCMELLWALQVYGVGAGLTHFVSVSYLGLEPMFRRAGYRFHRLGCVVPMDGTQVAAFQHEVDPATLERASHRLGAPGTLLRPPASFFPSPKIHALPWA